MFFGNIDTKLKYKKRAEYWSNSTGSCTADVKDKKKLEARSYRHWLFLTNVKGLVVFNNYNYSSSTNSHQSAVLDLLKQCRIKIDVMVNQQDSLCEGIDLEPFYRTALLCEVRLERKGLRQNSRADLERQQKDALKYIERLTKSKIVKPYKRAELKAMKVKIQQEEQERLSGAREANKAKREQAKALKPVLSNFAPVRLELLDDEMNALNKIEVK